MSHDSSFQKIFSYILMLLNWIGYLNTHAIRLHCYKRHITVNNLAKDNENSIECLDGSKCV